MEAAQRLRFRRRHVLEKVDGGRTDVAPARAEWREPDRKAAQTVQQVLPEGARAHGLFEVAIRRCDDPDVALADRLATDRLDPGKAPPRPRGRRGETGRWRVD